MQISIFGLGYVGAVSAGCLAQMGHRVVGVDVSESKVDAINAGRSPVVEPGLGELLEKYVGEGRIRATSDAADAVAGTDISFISVGTPSQPNGRIDPQFVLHVVEQIATLAKRKEHHSIAIRSTCMPDVVDDLIKIVESNSGRAIGQGIGFAVNPEFLRESTSIKDFFEPPKVVIGAADAQSRAALTEIYESINAPQFYCTPQEASLVKYADNCFHAVKVVFGNEIGTFCKTLGVDSHRVMEIFCADTKLNISKSYLRPGFAFGGSCLPKDLRALMHRTGRADLALPMLANVLASNDAHVQRLVDALTSTGKRRFGLLGLSFKAGTDDLRESPMVTVAERLLGKGFDLGIYDPDVSLAKLTGVNKKYIETEIPHISSLLSDNISEISDKSDVLIIAAPLPENPPPEQIFKKNQIVFDLVRAVDPEDVQCKYNGICW